MFHFTPPLGLRSRHLQTLLSPNVVRGAPESLQLAPSHEEIIACRDGARISALIDTPHDRAPVVIIIHGWLGNADSSYVLRAKSALLASGINVARLVLRDHGGTAALNATLFNSARLGEVVDSCRHLIERYGQTSAGLVGFSLGGNFAVRVGTQLGESDGLRDVLAICPVIDPRDAIQALDDGFPIYRWYFMRNWRRALVEKQSAFPNQYDFSGAKDIRSVSALTAYFVERYTEYASLEEYYDRYALPAGWLSKLQTNTTLVATLDDPVIPAAGLSRLISHPRLSVIRSPHGGHCGFLSNYRLDSYIDAFISRHCQAAIG